MAIKFYEAFVTGWKEFKNKYIDEARTSLQMGKWVFRGQSNIYPLSTSLERAGKKYDIDWSHLPGVERQMIRHFRRHFQDARDPLLDEDKLYCISVMQHYGAPTRLLDFTWSIYIGSFFALEKLGESPVLWCINQEWVNKASEAVVGKRLLKKRWTDKERNDESYEKMYEKNNKFINFENPIRQNMRLGIQRGIFMCPGDISSTLEANLQALKGWNDPKNILKIFFNFEKKESIIALEELRLMNITRSSLFPGLDGYSQSMWQLMPLFRDVSLKKAGEGGPYHRKTNTKR
jgi:hypothetical protein